MNIAYSHIHIKDLLTNRSFKKSVELDPLEQMTIQPGQRLVHHFRHGKPFTPGQFEKTLFDYSTSRND